MRPVLSVATVARWSLAETIPPKRMTPHRPKGMTRDYESGNRLWLIRRAGVPARHHEPREDRVPGTVAGGSAAGADQPALQRVADELRAGSEPELLLDVRAVGLDGAHRQIQLRGDLCVGVPERDQSQHVGLTLGEIVRRSGGRLGGD